MRIGCLNVRGLKGNSSYVSEHWLHDYELRNFHPDFNFYAIAAPQAEDNLYCVPKHIRGHGGAAIAWRKSLDQYVKRLTNISSHRVVGIQNPDL